MINKYILQGRLTKKPELRTTQNGTNVCSFTVAWNERRSERERKLFMPCVAWGERAVFISKNIDKGQEIIVDGNLSQRSWEDESGKKHDVIEMTVENINFCGKRDGSKSDDSNQGTPFVEAEDDGELPF